MLPDLLNEIVGLSSIEDIRIKANYILYSDDLQANIKFTPTESSLRSRPPSAASGVQMKYTDSGANSSKKVTLDSFADFPRFNESEQLKIVVQFPSIPFTFIIPHPDAREPKPVHEAEIIEDVGDIDESVVQSLVDDCDGDRGAIPTHVRPSSQHKIKSPELQVSRPQSAGTYPDDIVIGDIPIKTPRRKLKVPLKEPEEDENWGDDEDEENLLEKMEQGE